MRRCGYFICLLSLCWSGIGLSGVWRGGSLIGRISSGGILFFSGLRGCRCGRGLLNRRGSTGLGESVASCAMVAAIRSATTTNRYLNVVIYIITYGALLAVIIIHQYVFNLSRQYQSSFMGRFMAASRCLCSSNRSDLE